VQSYQFTEAFKWYCKLQNILPIFRVPSFHNKLHLIDVLLTQTQTGFRIGQTVYFRFINRYVSMKQIVHHFPS